MVLVLLGVELRESDKGDRPVVRRRPQLRREAECTVQFGQQPSVEFLDALSGEVGKEKPRRAAEEAVLEAAGVRETRARQELLGARDVGGSVGNVAVESAITQHLHQLRPPRTDVVGFLPGCKAHKVSLG